VTPKRHFKQTSRNVRNAEPVANLNGTTMAKNRSVYFIINSVWELLDTPLYRNNPHTEDDLTKRIQNIALLVSPAPLQHAINNVLLVHVMHECEPKETTSSTFFS
jgi:hypothetical protein